MLIFLAQAHSIQFSTAAAERLFSPPSLSPSETGSRWVNPPASTSGSRAKGIPSSSNSSSSSNNNNNSSDSYHSSMASTVFSAIAAAVGGRRESEEEEEGVRRNCGIVEEDWPTYLSRYAKMWAVSTVALFGLKIASEYL